MGPSTQGQHNQYKKAKLSNKLFEVPASHRSYSTWPHWDAHDDLKIKTLQKQGSVLEHSKRLGDCTSVMMLEEIRVSRYKIWIANTLRRDLSLTLTYPCIASTSANYDQQGATIFGLVIYS